MTCPGCQGTRTIRALSKPIDGPCFSQDIACYICMGTGEVSEAWAEQRANGTTLREHRMAKHWSVRDLARALNIPVRIVSEMEHGRRPIPQDVWLVFVDLPMVEEE